MTTHLLAIAASTRPNSLNKKLLAVAIAHAQASGAEVEVIDYQHCHVETYRDDPSQPFPPGAQRVCDALRRADGLLLASPEYNWSIPGGLKNLIDWLSTVKPSPFAKKTALLMCASPSVRGGILGLNQLSVPLNHLGVYVYPHLVAIGEADAQLSEGGIGNRKDAAFLKNCVADFVRVTSALKE